MSSEEAVAAILIYRARTESHNVVKSNMSRRKLLCLRFDEGRIYQTLLTVDSETMFNRLRSVLNSVFCSGQAAKRFLESWHSPILCLDDVQQGLY
jgi:hypothetical protein